MSDVPIGEFEQDFGSTTQYSGTVGTSPINIPTVAADPIVTCFIRCPAQTPATNRLLFSIDGGSIFHTLSPGEFIIWSPKGNQKQIKIKGNAASISYEVTLNTEPT
jgi:hypothetical protein